MKAFKTVSGEGTLYLQGVFGGFESKGKKYVILRCM